VYRNLWPFIKDSQHIEMLYDSYLLSQTFPGAEDAPYRVTPYPMALYRVALYLVVLYRVVL
jgi:hypothetical protein